MASLYHLHQYFNILDLVFLSICRFFYLHFLSARLFIFNSPHIFLVNYPSFLNDPLFLVNSSTNVFTIFRGERVSKIDVEYLKKKNSILRRSDCILLFKQKCGYTKEIKRREVPKCRVYPRPNMQQPVQEQLLSIEENGNSQTEWK